VRVLGALPSISGTASRDDVRAQLPSQLQTLARAAERKKPTVGEHVCENQCGDQQLS
jgi:hypothetical protein